MNRFKENIAKNNALYICYFFFITAFLCYLFYLKFLGAKYFWPATFLGGYMSLPFDYMHEHLWKSLLYYHIQLPFYLLYTYLFEYVLFPVTDPNFTFLRGFFAYYVLHMAFGLWMIYSMYKMMELYKVNKWLACILISVFVSTPSFYIYASQGVHDFITTALLCISAYLFFLALEKKKLLSYFLFFFILALLINVRAVFHPLLFFVPIVLLLLIFNFRSWRNIMLAALLPFVLAMLPYAKNYVIFGKFTGTTHSGVYYVQSTYEWYLPNEQKPEHIEKGNFSELVFCTPSSTTYVYKGFTYNPESCLREISPKYGKKYYEENLASRHLENIPILWGINGKEIMDQSNHIYFIGRNEQNAKDAIKYATLFPINVLRRIAESWRLTFKPSINYMYSNARNNRYLPDNFLWMSHNIWPGKDFTIGKDGSICWHASLPLIILFPLVLLFAAGTALNISNLSKKLGFFAVTLFLAILVMLLNNGGVNNWLDMKLQHLALGMALVYFLLWLLSFIIFGNYQKNGLNNFNLKQLSIYLLVVILYSTNLAALFSGTEHNRYRTYIDPLLLVLFAGFIGGFFVKKVQRENKKSQKKIS